MDYKELEKFFSKEKLNTYVLIKNDNKEVEDLFIKNLDLSAYFYKLIQIFELSTRNIFDYTLTKKYGNWLNSSYVLGGNNGLNTKLVNDINKAMNVKINSSNSDIISNLSLGFWVSLLSNNNKDKIWQPAIKKIFINYDRNYIHNIFIEIKDIRNRISHHETIINRDTDKIKKEILFILSIYSKNLFNWTLKNVK